MEWIINFILFLFGDEIKKFILNDIEKKRKENLFTIELTFKTPDNKGLSKKYKEKIQKKVEVLLKDLEVNGLK